MLAGSAADIYLSLNMDKGNKCCVSTLQKDQKSEICINSTKTNELVSFKGKFHPTIEKSLYSCSPTDGSYANVMILIFAGVPAV